RIGENDEIYITPGPVVPEEARIKLGPDFKWTDLRNDETEQVLQCVTQTACDTDILKQALAQKLFFDEAMKVATCVQLGACDGPFFFTIYEASKNGQEFGFTNDALVGATCAKRPDCDANAFLKVYQLNRFTEDATEVAMCVKTQGCGLNAY